jgi:hypothetical protein
VTVNSARLRAEDYTATATSVRWGRATSTRSPESSPEGEASTLALLGSTEEEQFEGQEAATG